MILHHQLQQENAMRMDKSAHDIDPCTIPGEFKENYRFLSELIRCRDKNYSICQGLASLGEANLMASRGQLNRRQLKIVKDFFSGIHQSDGDGDSLPAPVPEELEASIRIRKRSTWLPWEAEAIRKIEKWREDAHFILQNRSVHHSHGSSENLSALSRQYVRSVAAKRDKNKF
ncbi:MAG: hypothetical protein QG577_1715 [Thermodesulfobacteriota bacterium]|nr:hypothetical protein [Thermodesulfobacteriota bacterium]